MARDGVDPSLMCYAEGFDLTDRDSQMMGACSFAGASREAADADVLGQFLGGWPSVGMEDHSLIGITWPLTWNDQLAVFNEGFYILGAFIH